MESLPSILFTNAQRDIAWQALERGLRKTLKAKPPITCSRWCDENFYLSAESSGQEGPWTTLPYQVAILDLIGADEPRIVDLKKSARIGYTKMLVGATAYRLEHKRRNVAHFQPTDGDALEFCKTEIDPMIRDVPLMADLSDESSNKKRDDTLRLKRLGKKHLYIRGGNSPARYRRITVDCIDYDELDGFDPEIGNEGDALSLGDRAITNSSFPRSFRGSTPANKHDSLIERESNNASLNFTYHVSCPECGHPQAMTWSQFKWEPRGDGVTQEQRADSVVYDCINCRVPWEYREIVQLLESGHWRSDERNEKQVGECEPWAGTQIVTGEHDPYLIDHTGLVIDWPRHIALHIWAAYSMFVGWSELVHEWLDAQGHVLKLKTFTNHKLGEVWGDEADDIDENVLHARREAYGVPNEILAVVATVDVQETWAEIAVSGYDPNERSWLIKHQRFEGLTDKYPDTIWSDMAEFLEGFECDRNDGTRLRINAIAVDTGHHTDAAYMFCVKLKHRRVYPIKGVGGDRGIVTLPGTKKQALDGTEFLLYSAGVDWGKRVVMNRLRSDSVSRIELNLSVTEEQCEQFTAERLITQYRRGFAKRLWQKTRDRNEMLDLYCYQLVALYLLKPDWVKLAKRFPTLGDDQVGEDTKKSSVVTDRQTETRRRRLRARRGRRNPVTQWGQ